MVAPANGYQPRLPRYQAARLGRTGVEEMSDYMVTHAELQEEYLREAIETLEEAAEVINEQLDNVWEALCPISGSKACRIVGRARSYWIPQMIMALKNDHQYLGGAGVSLQDTLEELYALTAGEDGVPVR